MTLTFRRAPRRYDSPLKAAQDKLHAQPESELIEERISREQYDKRQEHRRRSQQFRSLGNVSDQ